MQRLCVNGKTCDRTYLNDYNAYKKYVIQNIYGGNDPGLTDKKFKYLTLSNVDCYYAEIVANKKVIKNSANRIGSSLQFYADNREYAEYGAGYFKVTASSHVAVALAAQEVTYRKHEEAKAKSKNTDPHNGLRINVLSDDDHFNALTYIYVHNNWGDLSFAWTWGTNSFIRGASARAMKLRDIVTSKGALCPERAGLLSRMICLVLRKGQVHKENHLKDRVVGCWRHRNWIQCGELVIFVAI